MIDGGDYNAGRAWGEHEKRLLGVSAPQKLSELVLTLLKLMLSGSLLFSRAALFCFSAGEAVEQELQYILWQSLRGGSVEFGETGLSHEAVHLADEEVDEFGR